MLDRATSEQLDRIEGMLAELLGKHQQTVLPVPLRDDLRRKESAALFVLSQERRSARAQREE